MPLVLNLPTWLHGYPTATRHSASYKPKATYRTPTSSCPLPSLYTARFPLIGFEAVDSLPMLADPAALHVALVIDCSQNGVWLFDFLPADPQNPLVLSKLISGGGVPGEARARKLRGLPPRRHLIGESRQLNAVDKAAAVQEQWNGSELKLLQRDCRHFVDALIAELR